LSYHNANCIIYVKNFLNNIFNFADNIISSWQKIKIKTIKIKIIYLLILHVLKIQKFTLKLSRKQIYFIFYILILYLNIFLPLLYLFFIYPPHSSTNSLIKHNLRYFLLLPFFFFFSFSIGTCECIQLATISKILWLQVVYGQCKWDIGFLHYIIEYVPKQMCIRQKY